MAPGWSRRIFGYLTLVCWVWRLPAHRLNVGQACSTTYVWARLLQQALELRKGMTDIEGEEQQLDRVN